MITGRHGNLPDGDFGGVWDWEGDFPTVMQDVPLWYPQRTFIVPNPAKYPLSIVSEPAVAPSEFGIAAADSSVKTWPLPITDMARERSQTLCRFVEDVS